MNDKTVYIRSISSDIIKLKYCKCNPALRHILQNSIQILFAPTERGKQKAYCI